MLNLNDLLMFVQIVDNGGFTAASKKLGVPKSTLSKRLQELERAAGARLAQRTSRSFTVTDLGRELYRHASAMAIEAEAAENVVLGRLAEPSGAVRLTASVPTAQHALAALLPQIAETYPKIRLVLHASDRFVDIVQEGFDIAIRDHFHPLPDSGLVQRRLGRTEIWLVAAPGYLRRARNPSDPSELAEMDGLMVSPAERQWKLTGPDDRVVEVSPLPRMYADEGIALLEAARAGLGIACLPRSVCAADLEGGKLVRILPGWTAGRVTTTLLMPHRRGLLPSVRVVADMIAERLSAARAD